MRQRATLCMAACLAAVVASGCATARGPADPIRIEPGAQVVNYLLVDVVADEALGGWYRYTLVYSGHDTAGRLVVAGRDRVRSVTRAQVAKLVSQLVASGVMTESSQLGSACDDCTTWRILVRINDDENSFFVGRHGVGGGLTAPEIATQLAALAGES